MLWIQAMLISFAKQPKTTHAKIDKNTIFVVDLPYPANFYNNFLTLILGEHIHFIPITSF